MVTSLLSSGGDSLATSATKASRTVALPRMLISVVAVSTLSRSAPQVGHVLASGSVVGGRSQIPLSTACRTSDKPLLKCCLRSQECRELLSCVKGHQNHPFPCWRVLGLLQLHNLLLLPSSLLGRHGVPRDTKLRSKLA